MTIAALLDILKITKQSLNRVLKELVAKNFIDARAGATDRRHRQLYATEEGEKLARELAQAADPTLCRRASERLGPGGEERCRRRSCIAMIDAGGTRAGHGTDRRSAARRRRLERNAFALAKTTRAHVLVVDDDRRLRDLLSTYLSKHGHRVTVAASAGRSARLPRKASPSTSSCST